MSRPLEKPTARYHRGGPQHPLDTVRESRAKLLSTRPPAPAAVDEEPSSGVRAASDADDPLAHLSRLAQRRVGQLLTHRYELRGLLGTGSAGAVYESWDRHHQRLVAIKVLHESLKTSDEHVSRFKSEARAAASIGHSGIVSVLDVGRETDGSLYMTMELLRGQALFYAITEDSLDDEDIVEVGRQLLDALAAAHDRGIVHRDVKPENIFLANDLTGTMRVKLLDFGIAKNLRPEHGRSISTLDGLLIGTPHYMSPEMCTGAPVDEQADVWAACAVLFHAFAGRPPFDDDHIGRLLMRIVSGRAPSLAKHRPHLPPQIVRAIDRGLSRDRDARWATAKDLAAALTVGSAAIDGLDW